MRFEPMTFWLTSAGWAIISLGLKFQYLWGSSGSVGNASWIKVLEAMQLNQFKLDSLSWDKRQEKS